MIDVAALRASLGWSQTKLAQCVGCDQSTIDRTEERQAREGVEALGGAAALVFARLAELSKTHALAGMKVSDVRDLLVGRCEPPLPVPASA